KFPWEPGFGLPCYREWTDNDELAVMEWMHTQAGVEARRNDIFAAICRVADGNKFHPVREYLDTLEWDQVQRVEQWMVNYFGAENNFYYREIGSRSLYQGVARIYRPGCKADCMTVLEGKQGLLKSSSIRVLFDPKEEGWFTDQLSEIGSKDSSLELRGVWCA